MEIADFTLDSSVGARVNEDFLEYERVNDATYPKNRCHAQIDRVDGGTWKCNYLANHRSPHDAWMEGSGLWVAHWQNLDFYIIEEQLDLADV